MAWNSVASRLHVLMDKADTSNKKSFERKKQ